MLNSLCTVCINVSVLCVYRCSVHRDLNVLTLTFPTQRSSDLSPAVAGGPAGAAGARFVRPKTAVRGRLKWVDKRPSVEGQLAGDAGQVARRNWSTGLAMIGQQAGNPNLDEKSERRKTCRSEERSVGKEWVSSVRLWGDRE